MDAIIVPIRLDAFFAEHEMMAVEAKADFTRLPFNNGVEDVNTESGFLSENIISHPFQNKNYLIRPGIHLHWALPDALTSAQVQITEDSSKHVKHPYVPDRWLIRRKELTYKGNKTLQEKFWIVESSYFHPEGKDNFYHAVNIPYHPINKKENSQPFRYMGRSFEIDPVTGTPSGAIVKGNEYYDQLTAVAYGEPTFAAFYPNCHSVFGFQDHDITTDILNSEVDTNLFYEVLGWYAIGKNDAETIKNIKAKLEWQGKETIDPDTFLFYTSINFRKVEYQNKSADTISIGNTGTEALSAFVANNLYKDPEKIFKTEDQLEALQLLSRVAGNNLDTGPAFYEAFHEKGFSSASGGFIWSLKISDNTNKDRSASNNQAQSATGIEIDLPDSYAHWLNELNIIQQDSDKENFVLESLKGQLFADWYKYMVAAYHPDIDNSLPDVDQIRFFIENFSIAGIQNKIIEIKEREQQLTSRKAAFQILRSLFNSSGEFKFIDEKNKIANEDYKRIFEKTYKNDDVAGDPRIVADISFGNLFVADCSKDKIEIKPGALNSPLAAISCWVKINSNQNNEAGYLLKMATISNTNTLTDLPDMRVAMDGIGNFWTTIYINGTPPDPYRKHEWTDFPNDQWIHIYLSGSPSISDPVILTFFDNLGGSFAGIRLHKAALTEDEIFCDRNMFKLKSLELTRDAAARYWRPNDPVVLIAGSIAEPSKRYGYDGSDHEKGLLTCYISTIDNLTFANEDPGSNATTFNFANLILWFNNNSGFFAKTFPPGETGKPGTTTWTGNPWHPVMLEWKVEIKPYKSGNFENEGGENDSLFQFPPEFILKNYQLKDGEPELSIKNNVGYDPGRIYSGSSILTPHAKIKLTDTIEKYLLTGIETIGEKFIETKNHPGFSFDEFRKRFDGSKMEENTKEKLKYILGACNKSADDLIALSINAHDLMQNNHMLSQSLGGLNAALLMLHQTMQLPVDEPLGFTDARQFTNKVAGLIGRENKFAPLPLYEFDPLRTGIINILELAVIDSFGQSVPLDLRNDSNTKTCFSRSFQSGDIENYLPPRFIQYSRLSFRWKSANHDDVEMNSHAASSPVCGWIVPNNINATLMIYNQDGYMIGVIDTEGNWQAVPGNYTTIEISLVDNKWLGDIITKLTGPNKSIRDFIGLLDTTLERIDPENFAQHMDLAMLMGRPIAIVRASVNFEIRGNPAINQDWDSFQNDMSDFDKDGVSKSRNTNAWENVKVPIRIGEPGKLNDGVVGYWIEDEEFSSNFYSVLNDAEIPASAGRINVLGFNPARPAIAISAGDNPVNITMLFDPRGKAHATCGVVPVKILSLPDDQFKPALKKMSVTFFTRPLLTPVGETAIPLPAETGYNWSWLTSKNNNWIEIATTGVVHKEAITGAFAKGEEIWNELLKKGWLADKGNYRAGVVPQNQRKDTEPGALLGGQLTRIQEILDKGHIIPVNTKPDFNLGTEAIEGWLKLTPANNSIK